MRLLLIAIAIAGVLYTRHTLNGIDLFRTYMDERFCDQTAIDRILLTDDGLYVQSQSGKGPLWIGHFGNLYYTVDGQKHRLSCRSASELYRASLDVLKGKADLFPRDKARLIKTRFQHEFGNVKEIQ